MHHPRTAQAALELGAAGFSATEVGRELGIPRATVRDWLGGKLPCAASRDPNACGRCGHDHPFEQLPDSYVYLLGLYLGDGAFRIMRAVSSGYASFSTCVIQ